MRVVFSAFLLTLACASARVISIPGIGELRIGNAPALQRGPGRGRGPPPGSLPPSTNATAAYALLRRDFLFFERFTTLLLRSATRALLAVRDYLGRSVGFPPRVMVVTLSGIIAADDEVHHRSSLALLDPDFDDPLLRTSFQDDDWKARVRGRQGNGQLINLERCERQLERAFSAHGAKAVCIVINSPGGSPAQSSLIFQRLRALRKRYKRVPLIAFVEDSAVSGGYYIASAADEIIADPSSLVGSIGVISRGFGYVKAIKKQGVSRRVHTAGASKGGIDPYMPQRKRDLAAQARLLKEIHANFIAAVKEGRGARLQPEAAAKLHHATSSGWSAGCFGPPNKRQLSKLVDKGVGLFDGSVYSGEVGKELGLVDAVGELKTALQARYGRYVRLELVEDDRIDYSRLLRWLF